MIPKCNCTNKFVSITSLPSLLRLDYWIKHLDLKIAIHFLTTKKKITTSTFTLRRAQSSVAKSFPHHQVIIVPDSVKIVNIKSARKVSRFFSP